MVVNKFPSVVNNPSKGAGPGAEVRSPVRAGNPFFGGWSDEQARQATGRPVGAETQVDLVERAGLTIPPARLDPTHCHQASPTIAGAAQVPEPPWKLVLIVPRRPRGQPIAA